MGLEIERKHLDADFTDVERRLREAGAKTSGWHFDTSMVFDSPHMDLFKEDRLLRLRLREWTDHSDALLTFKGPGTSCERMLKRREELETEVSDFHAMRLILERLGYAEVARYEKARETWQLKMGASDKVTVDLDKLSFCQSVEIEGDPELIECAASFLGLDKCPFSAKSYYELHRDWLAEQGKPPAKSIVFSPEERESLRRSLGLICERIL